MGRAPCCDKVNVKKGPWSPEEDTKLKVFIEKHGSGGNWIALPKKAGLKRCGKSCRLRWLNYLRPNIKHGCFSVDEDRIICNLFASIGSRWSIIAGQLPGRTDNDIKNYWNTKLKKKILGFPTTQRKPHHHHHQQNHLTFQSSFHNTAPSPSTQSSSFYDPPPNPFFPCFEGLPLSSYELTPFQHLLHVPLHHYQMNSSSRLLVFSNDQSCSSSDGRCRQVNDMGFGSYVHGGVEGAQKLLNSRGGCGTPLEYKHEEYNTTYLDDLSTSSASAARLEDIRFRSGPRRGG